MPQRRKTAADLGEAVAIGRRLREVRELFGVSQADLGAAIGGRVQQVIDRYESGKSRIPLGVAIQICREYGVRLEWLAEGNPPMLVADELYGQALIWVKTYAATLREYLTDEFESASGDVSIEPRIRKACEMARAALQEIPDDELTMDTFSRLPWELIRPLNVLLTDHAPAREPHHAKAERDRIDGVKQSYRRTVEELTYRCGGNLLWPLPKMIEESTDPEKLFERLWPNRPKPKTERHDAGKKVKGRKTG